MRRSIVTCLPNVSWRAPLRAASRVEALIKVGEPSGDAFIAARHQLLITPIMFLRRREIAEIEIAQDGEIEMGIGIFGLQRPRLLVSGARFFEMTLLTVEHTEVIVSAGILRMPLDGTLEGLLRRSPLAALIIYDAEIGVRSGEFRMLLRERGKQLLGLLVVTVTKCRHGLFVIGSGEVERRWRS